VYNQAGYFPQPWLCAAGLFAIGIESVDAVVLGGHEDHVMYCASHGQLAHIQDLGMYVAIKKKRGP
jgi:hypothetical protein